MPNSPRIYISYRHADSKDVTERIHDRLTEAFGSANVIRDPFEPGDDIRGRIREEVAICTVMLVIIGRDWLAIPDPNNPSQRKIDAANDWVRFEIETALQRGDANVRLIPVVVKGAHIPLETDLPPSIAELAFKNAAIIRYDPDFNTDVNRLIAGLGGAKLTPLAASTPNTIARFLASPIWQGIGGLAAIAAIALTLVLAQGNANQPVPTPIQSAAPSSTNTPLPPTATDTLVPLSPPQPTSTVTVNYQLDETATQIMLQRTADAKAATNAALFAESTQLAETANAKTIIAPATTSTVPLSPTSLPIAREYPCEAQIVSSGDATTLRGVIFSRPSTTSTTLSVTMQVEQRVIISRKTIDKQQIWYQLILPTGGVIGWILSDYVQASSECPTG